MFPKILTKKQKNILLLIIEAKTFDFKNLIDESDLIFKPENLSDGVLKIDFNVYKNCFTEDGFISLESVLDLKRKIMTPKRDKKNSK